MKYYDFQEKMKPFPVFSIREIEKQFPALDRRRLVEWQAKGYLQKLRNGYYCFGNQEYDDNFLYYMANQIYHPSYISLESALAFYGFIPEGVFEFISCSTLKNQRFKNTYGTFVYFHLKNALFLGYRLIARQNYHYALAEPEKALVDYLYLHPEIKQSSDLEERRWNLMAIREQIDRKKLDELDNYIGSPALSRRLSLLKELLDVTTR